MRKQLENIKTLSTIFCVAVVLLMASATQAMTSPDQVVKNTVDELVNNIQANRAAYIADNNELYAMVERVLIPAIHVGRMGGLILGKHRKTASPEQIKQFTKEFQTFLMRTYASALLEYTGNEKVIYEPVRSLSVDKVEIKANLLASNGQGYPISLFMSNRGDTQWRAYNINVVGIDFVGTYRSTFGNIITQKGMDGFLADLKKKNNKLVN